MKKEDIKLIASDMDGTLINDNEELPENFFEMLEKLEERGILFTAISGRGVFSIKNKIDHSANNFFIIADNGAIIMQDDDIINVNSFSQEDYKELIKVYQGFDDNMIAAATPFTTYIKMGNTELSDEFLHEFFHTYQLVDDLLDINDDIVSLSFHCPDGAEKYLNLDIINELKKDHKIIKSGAYWMDTLPPNNNKGLALKILTDKLKIDMKNVIAFGDYNNDIEMIQEVGKGFAMQDATDEVKAVADEIIGSNNDNSVVKKIYELLEL